MWRFSVWVYFQCRKMLTLRQQLIQEDYKVSRTFVDACRKDIRDNACIEGTQGATHAIKMSMILLCLESAHKASKHMSSSQFSIRVLLISDDNLLQLEVFGVEVGR